MRQTVIAEAKDLGWTHRRAPTVDTFERDGDQLLVAWEMVDPDTASSATRISGDTVTRVCDDTALSTARCWLGSPWV
jgi:hypothetical protein